MKSGNVYQGSKKKDYFEGYYYKFVSKQGITLSVIVGVSTSINDTHAFIQVINNYNHKTYYIRYPIASFKSCDSPFSLTLENSIFTNHDMIIHIDDVIQLHGTISWDTVTPLDSSTYAPSIMGPFAYIPWMECVHGIISLRHTISGTLQLNDTQIVFDDGFGYIEKDLGSSFPKRYIWIQGILPNTLHSFFLSYATIPLGPLHFNGLICVLEIDKKQYRFATYNHSRVSEIKHTANHVDMTIKKGKYRLQLTLTKQNGHPLVAPKKGNMQDTILESLDDTLQVSLYESNILKWDATFPLVTSEISNINKST